MAVDVRRRFASSISRRQTVTTDQVPVPQGVPTPGWTTPLWVSEDNPGRIGEVEGDMCLLDSGLVAITTWGSDTFGLDQWVIRPGNVPEKGPHHFDSSDFDWTSVPGYESLGPADPAGEVWSDICITVPTGPYSWAVTGQAQDSDPAGAPGDEPIAAFYSVDPATLVISRTRIDYHADAEFYADEVYAARYGDSVALLPQVGSAAGPRIAIAHPGGSSDLIDVPYTGWGILDRPGPIAVVGDVVLMFDEYNGISTWHLNGSGQIARITQAIGQDDWEWAMFTCPMTDGRVAVVCSGPTLSYTDNTLPVKVAIINLSPLRVDTIIDVAPFARSVGWTGGWKSNVRSMQQMPNGLLVVSWVTSSIMHHGDRGPGERGGDRAAHVALLHLRRHHVRVPTGGAG
jgi:hypothetical protein